MAKRTSLPFDQTLFILAGFILPAFFGDVDKLKSI